MHECLSFVRIDLTQFKNASEIRPTYRPTVSHHDSASVSPESGPQSTSLVEITVVGLLIRWSHRSNSACFYCTPHNVTNPLINCWHCPVYTLVQSLKKGTKQHDEELEVIYCTGIRMYYL